MVATSMEGEERIFFFPRSIGICNLYLIGAKKIFIIIFLIILTCKNVRALKILILYV